MSEGLELLDSEAHRDLKVNVGRYDAPCFERNVSVVMVSELETITHEYPVFAIKTPTTGQFQLIALLGFGSGENLYVDGSNWNARHLPLDMLRHPFQVYLPKDEAGQEGRLAVDVSSPLLGSNSGIAIFDKDGNATPYLERIKATFGQMMSGSKQTSQFLKKLNDHQLLEPVTLNIDLPNGEKDSIDGLYTIDEEKLKSLPGSALEDLNSATCLQASYLMISSKVHVNRLLSWKHQRKA